MLAVPLILYMYELEPKPPTHEILEKKHKLAKGPTVHKENKKHLSIFLYPKQQNSDALGQLVNDAYYNSFNPKLSPSQPQTLTSLFHFNPFASSYMHNNNIRGNLQQQ